MCTKLSSTYQGGEEATNEGIPEPDGGGLADFKPEARYAADDRPHLLFKRCGEL